MLLKSSEQRQILEAIQTKRTKPQSCPSCGAQEWAVNDMVIEMREYARGNLVVGGPIFPAVAVVCRNCGYTQFFSAVVLGVLDKKEEDSLPHKEAVNE